MTELLTAERMRAIEGAAIAEGAVTGLDLMERAGRGVVAALLAERPERAARASRAAVLCGPGNNGGDGFVVARLLHARGWEVEVFLYGRDPGEIDRLPPDAAANARRWAALGPIRALDAHPLPPDALVIDALFGTGLTRPLGPDLARRLAAEDVAFRPPRDLVAVDAPSGLCLDSGRVLGEAGALRVGLTVTFHAPKLGHYLAEGPALCGALRVVDIGLSDPGGAAPVALLPRPDEPPAEALAKRGAGHKYDHGHVLVLAGGVGRGGAARLAARAALRVGAGLVTVGCPPAALIENAARLDAVMLRPLADPQALAAALDDPRIAALCLGPGLGADRARALVPAALAPQAQSDARSEEPGPSAARPPRGVVLDADALTAFEADPEALWAHTHPRCVLTPHDGEFARLFPDLAAPLRAPARAGPAPSRVDAVRAAAARAGAVVLLKGPDTVIAAPDGAASVHSAAYARAAPWLATAGAGDVLAGLIAGLLARGCAPRPAAEAAAWLHVEAARAAGPGLIAEDLPEALPGVFRDLGL